MSSNLQVETALNETAQPIHDQEGNNSSLNLSADKVGIGTATPLRKIGIKTNANGAVEGIVIQYGDEEAWGIGIMGPHNSNPGSFTIEHLDEDNAFHTKFLIDNGVEGNIGMGTTKPEHRLHVKVDNSPNVAVFESAHEENASWIWLKNSGVSGGYNSVGIGSLNDDLRLRAGDSTRVFISKVGNVGIGTERPGSSLHVKVDSTVNAAIFESTHQENTSWIWLKNSGVTGDYNSVGIGSMSDDLLLRAGDKTRVFISKDGKVGIGTLDPSEQLDVRGNIYVTGDILLAGADCAEEFDVEEAEELEPGTVMIIADDNKLSQCSQAYDKRVSGVLSGAGSFKPGIVLDRQPSQNKRMPLALNGKVFCKVDATFGAVEVGDLLTTSPTGGHAMKVDDPFKAFGAVLGKALQPLLEGQGLIPVLVALQ